MADHPRTIDSQLIHSGEPRPRFAGAVSLPIFQSSTFEFGGAGNYHDVRYIRLNNTPNHQALADKLRAIENAEAALVTGSGMAAISAALLAVLESGSHILLQDCLYGGTHTFVTHELARLGITYDFIDGNQPSTWEAARRPETKAIYVEAMTNPLLEVIDLPAVVAFAKAHNLVSLIDSTFASPVNLRPIDLGFDLSLHSATKYLNGHSDIVAGVIAGRSHLVETARHRLNHFGGSLDPHACFLLQRGLKTLAIRVRQQNANAMALATALARHRAVTRVNYPGLSDHPNHESAKAQFDGFGGMLSLELVGGVAAADKLMAGLTLALVAPSLGGVETLITRPATTSHAGMSPQERERIGISDSLVRVSVGIESADELIEDFEHALATV